MVFHKAHTVFRPPKAEASKQKHNKQTKKKLCHSQKNGNERKCFCLDSPPFRETLCHVRTQHSLRADRPKYSENIQTLNILGMSLFRIYEEKQAARRFQAVDAYCRKVAFRVGREAN